MKVPPIIIVNGMEVMGMTKHTVSGDSDKEHKEAHHTPTKVQRDYLKRGLEQPGGKLPLFDKEGRAISPKTVRACISHGWAEPWFANPLKKDWLVCRLTEKGRKLLEDQN